MSGIKCVYMMEYSLKTLAVDVISRTSEFLCLKFKISYLSYVYNITFV